MSSAAVLLVASQLALTSSGSVKWLWYTTIDDCPGGDEGSALHVEWTPAEECLASANLRDGDPVRALAPMQGNLESDVTMLCEDPNQGQNFNAKDDFVLLSYYSSTDGSCTGTPIVTYNFSHDECAPHNRSMNAKFQCSRCRWVFMNESPPPYFVQAIGVFVFLVACVLLNVYLQDHFDRLIKKLPFMVFPCLNKPKQPLSPDEITVGVTVVVRCCRNFSQLRNQDRSPSGHDFSNGSNDPLEAMPPPPPPPPPPPAEEDVLLQEIPVERHHQTQDVDAFDSSAKYLDWSGKQQQDRFDQSVSTQQSFAQTQQARRSSNDDKDMAATVQLSLDIVDLLNTTNPLTSPTTPGMAKGAAGRGSAFANRRRTHTTRDSSFKMRSITPTPSADLDTVYAPSRASRTRRNFASTVKGSISMAAPSDTSVRSPLLRPTWQPDSPQTPASEVLSPWAPVTRSHSFTPGLDVVRDYSEHRTTSSPLMGPTRRLCIVCGAEARTGESKKAGFKCSECKGKAHNPLLAKVETFEEDLSDMAMQGLLGEFADVLSMRGDEQVYLAFRNVRVWVSRKAAEKLDTGRVEREKEDQEERERLEDMTGNRPLFPGDTGPTVWLDECWEPALLREAAKGGYRVTFNEMSWVGIQLLTPVCCWVPRVELRKLYDWGGQYVRVIGKREFRRAAKEKWKKWWSDFELCVGELMIMKRDPDDVSTLEAVIHFKGSATLIIPCEAVMACTQLEHDSEYLITPQKVSKRTMMAVFVASAPPLLAAKGLFLMVFFSYSVVTALSDGHAGRANHHSRWEAYEEVYFKLFNSGYPTLTADCGSVTLYFIYSFQPNMQQFVAGVGKPVLFTLAMAMGISLPGVVTHALPMVFVYAWMWVPIGVFIHFTYRLVRKSVPEPPQVDPEHEYDMKYYERNHKWYLVKSGFFYLLFRFLAELVAVLFIQTNFNYAIFLYEKSPYFSVIIEEFNSRQFACIIEMGLKMASLMW